MDCPFCGAEVEDEDALQDHQAFQCSAIQPQKSQPQQEAAVRQARESPKDEGTFVSFVWTSERYIDQEIVYLIGSNFVNNVELKLVNDGTYKSDMLQVPLGQFSGQLVVGDEMIPVNEFDIDGSADTIYLRRDGDTITCSVTDASELADKVVDDMLNTLTEKNNLTESDIGEIHSNLVLSPLHQELLKHQLQQPDPSLRNILDKGGSNLANLLEEESFASTSDHQAPNVVKSPEDHTLRNVEEIDAIPSKHIRDEADESESGLEDSVYSNSNHQKEAHNISVDHMLHELSMTDQEQESLTLPYLPSESQNKSRIEHEIEEAIEDEDDQNIHFKVNRVQSVKKRPILSRTSSRESSKSQDFIRMQTERDNIIKEYQTKSESYRDKIESLEQELGRKNDLLENYKEVKLELETKCASYEEELKRIHKENENLQNLLQRSDEQRTNTLNEMLAEKEHLMEKCEAFQMEMERCQNDYRELAENYSKVDMGTAIPKDDNENMEIIVELEAKCQSYDIEVEKLTAENGNIKRELSQNRRNVEEAVARIEYLELENRKLIETNSSLETAQKLHEEDVKTERDNLNQLIKKLQQEVMELRQKTVVSTLNEYENGLTPDENTTKNFIDKMKKENRILKDKLNLIRIESELHPSNIDKNYQPQIMSSSHLKNMTNGYPVTKLADHVSSRNKKTYSLEGHNMNGRHEDMTNYTAKVLPSRYDPAAYTRHSNEYSRTSPDYSSVSHDYPRNSVHAHENHVSDNSKRVPFNDRLDDIMKRYSGGSRNTVSPLDIEITKSRYKHSYEDNDFRSTRYSNLNHRNYHPKSRSLDVGMESVGLSDDEEDNFRRNMRAPFCPTASRDLKLGMKVSVSRTSGRLSRGTVKWIGLLPGRPGDFVGIELETESGRHDGYLDGVQYFRCKPGRGVFVKFSKVIMAWK